MQFEFPAAQENALNLWSIQQSSNTCLCRECEHASTAGSSRRSAQDLVKKTCFVRALDM